MAIFHIWAKLGTKTLSLPHGVTYHFVANAAANVVIVIVVVIVKKEKSFRQKGLLTRKKIEQQQKEKYIMKEDFESNTSLIIDTFFITF